MQKDITTTRDRYCPLPVAYCLLLIAYCLLSSCNSTYTSKKNGYFKIDFPKRKYTTFKREGFPYTFDYPVYAKIVNDTTYFDSSPENPYWIDVDFPEFGGRIFLSYKIVGGKAMYKVKQANGIYKDSVGINQYEKMVKDAFTLTDKNQAVASSIKETRIHTDYVSGVFFTVGGNAATSKQFFLSDTTKNFIRGALYFDATPNIDSIRPVLDFLQADIDTLINTFRWTNKSYK